MPENSSFRRICGENIEVIPVRDGLGILWFSVYLCTEDTTTFYLSDHSRNVVKGTLKIELLTQKNRLKRRFFRERWSEWRDLNPRHPAPKPMSEPSARPVAPSLTLSGTPAVPLWNSFGLYASRKTFVFWDLCGIAFCILKDVPSGFDDSPGYSIAERDSKIEPHKQ